MPFDSMTMLASPTGASLRLHAAHPRTRAIGVVHVNHGLAEHSARYERFAKALAPAGFHVYAHDHRGHGDTKAPDAPLGRFSAVGGVGKVMDDIAAVHAHIAQRRPGLPLILFGHSLGGIIALNSVLRRSDHLAGAAIWNANFSAGALGRVAQAILAWERMRLGSDVPSRILPALTFRVWNRKSDPKQTPAAWLSRDPSEVAKYGADPLCGWDASVSMWRDVFRMIFAGADDRNFIPVRKDLHFNLVGGASDPSTDHGAAIEALARRLRRMGFSNLASTVYQDTRHEGLNDLNRDIITSDFIAWAQQVVAERTT